jgi:starch synthase
VKIAMAAPEVAPFSKTGGLADVAGSLPPALARSAQVAVFTPFYRCVRESGIELRSLDTKLSIPVGGSTREARFREGGWPHSKAKVYFVECDDLFDRDQLYGTRDGDYPDNAERFSFFCRAVLEGALALDLQPDVVQAHDWQTGLLPVYLKTLYAERFPRSPRSVMTVHNLSYQGLFPPHEFESTGLPPALFGIDALEFYGKWSFLKGGLVFADWITTVSPTYAKEILREDMGCGLDGVLRVREASLSGILNGVDYSLWDPKDDPLIPKNYTGRNLKGKEECKTHLQRKAGLRRDKSIPVVGMVTRLVEQKGIDIFLQMAPRLGRDLVQFVILGSGQPSYEERLKALAAKDPEFFSVFTTFDNQLAHEIEAGADMFLMPSKFEPCGLNQIYSMRYGTIPLVRRTGGLADTVVDAERDNVRSGDATGFCFDEYSADALYACLQRALNHFQDRKLWSKLMANAMARDFSWSASAAEYLKLFRRLAREGPKSE